MLEQCLTLDAHLIEDHRRTEELSDDNDELSRKFLANIFDLFHGIVHRMSKVVVLLHFADPSFFPCRPRPPKKLTWGEMKKKARQTVGAIFLPPEWCKRCRDYFCVLHNPFNFFLQASAGCATLFAEAVRF